MHEATQPTDGIDFNAVRAALQKEHTQARTRMQVVALTPDAVAVDSDGVPMTDQVSAGALSEMLVIRLHEIESALARLDSGTYGLCTTCGGQIPPRRLQALPFAMHCVPCQAVADRKAKVHARADIGFRR